MTNNNATDNRQNNGDNITANNERSKRGEHPNSQANLKSYRPGESGNPSGRPFKKEKLARALNEFANEIDNPWSLDSENPITNKEKVLRIVWREAGKGNNYCIRMLSDLGCLDSD